MSPHAPRLLTEAPENLAGYVNTIAPFIESIYGARARDFYQATGLGLLRYMMLHPEIRTFASGPDGAPFTLLLARLGEERTNIFFIHALPEVDGADPALLTQAVSALSAEGRPIYTDYVSNSGLNLHATYLGLGFQCRERQLMRLPLVDPPPDRSGDSDCQAARPEDLASIAALLHAIYRDDPDRHLFPEAERIEKAQAWLESVRAGGLGRHEADWLIVARVDGRIAGFAVGTEVMPGMGFVLHLVVGAPYQGRGIGGRLLSELCGRFRVAGLDYAGLGVTCDNPAIRLYGRAGFQRVADVPIYFREAHSQ